MKPARIALWLTLPVLLIVAIWSLQAEEKKEGAKGDEAWLTSHDKALEQAKASKSPVLIDFTGSDWCPPCKALKAQVFDSDDFKTWAKENKLVLLELDFPRRKQQSEEQKKANQELAKKYKVEGFPTVVILTSEGTEVGRTVGFGGKEQWWTKAKDLLAKAKG